ncbi:hypothetical protein NUITMVK11_3450 (plasmid) [Klebsiella quasipneumoniae]|uniref:Uncharacterized protein n=1 Tax=Klebsiella quasipneumoniae TaxID=1463165 RepID=A0AB33INZ0_9ENTR|nr:hypothetical protein NUITMVK11_3450 [Klebsiella quasipneumoniae]
MKDEIARQIAGLIELNKFNGYTLVSGEDWQKPTVTEILLVRGFIPLRPVWCSPPGAVCAGWLDWGCRSITLSVAEDSLPDAS